MMCRKESIAWLGRHSNTMILALIWDGLTVTRFLRMANDVAR